MNSRLECRNGFALVIALVLMAFVFLLMVALSVTLQVEIASSRQSIALAQARETARMSALTALGELQRLMGPDMRVSARADLFAEGLTIDNPDKNVSPFDANDAARFWTGVWTSEDWNPGLASDREGRFLGWMLSMTDEQRERIDSAGVLPFNPQDDKASVTLARLPGAAVGGGDYEVRAPLRREISGIAYAWWISDEGVKASLNIDDPFAGKRETKLTEDLPRFLFPHRPNFSVTEWFRSTQWDDPLLQELRSRAETQSSYALVFKEFTVSDDARDALSRLLLGDFTNNAYGVLSDNRRGGLRGDLSLALWRDPAEWRHLGTGASFKANASFETHFRNHRIFNKEDYPQASQSIRSPSATNRSFFGPRWEVLRDYHNSFQKLVDPDDPDTAVRLVVPGMPEALYDMARTASASSWKNAGTRGRMAAPSILGGRDPVDQDSIQRGGEAAVPGEQILGIDSDSDVPVPIEMVTSGIYPLMQRATLFFNLDMLKIENPDAPGGFVYAPRINAYSIAHYWNPFNVTIASIDPLTGTDAGGWKMNINTRLKFKIERLNGSGQLIQSAEFYYDELRNSEIYAKNPGFNRAVGRTEFRAISGNDSFYFRPGEIRAFLLHSVQDEANWVEAGLMQPYNTNPRVFISYEQTGPTTDWPLSGSSSNRKRTTAPMLFNENDQLRVTLQYDPDGLGLRLASGGVEHNIGAGQSFRWVEVDSAAPSVEIIPDVTTLVDNPVELGGLEVRMKAADTPADQNPARILANFNPRALYPHLQMGTYAKSQPPNFQIRFLRGDPFDQIQWNTEELEDGRLLLRGFWGASDGAEGQNFVTLFDVPRRPPESLGQYQHAHFSIYAHQPAYPFGNSLADPHVRRTAAIDLQGGKTQMDLSWLLNDAIWDRYFLSTIDPDNPVNGRLAPQRERFMELDPTFTYSVSDPNGYLKPAENLLLRGAFNVNSTSVEAWAAYLSGLGGDGIRFYDTLAGSSATTTSLDSPFHRLTVPNGSENSAWLGGPRNLSRDEIRRLAEQMVKQVRQRGPFLSLSDFVNRRLSDDDRGLKGAIQAAIDDANLQTVNVGGNSVGASQLGAPFGQHAAGSQAEFAPGCLSQADVLTTLGPSITVRSDTFVIRAYGAVENPLTGEIQAEAWCEMLVQRFPEEHENPVFGRRFKIQSFRWLSPSEI